MLSVSTAALAETVVDVSKEWEAHRSSSTLASPTRSSASAPAARPEVVPSSASVSACGCEALAPQDYLEQSTYAFTGRVFDASVPKKGKRTIAFDVEEIFKGSPKPEISMDVEVLGNSCDWPFEVGETYLVFSKWEWGKTITSRCLGTKLLHAAGEDTREVGPSESLKEKLYIRLHNACMGRYDTPCCLSSLKAMRAGYYIPEPEEGCPSGSIPDRLHCAGSFTWCIPVTEKDHR